MKAPCGHKGEAVIGTFVRCTEGCDDDYPETVEDQPTEKFVVCEHTKQYVMDRKIWCETCGKFLKGEKDVYSDILGDGWLIR